MKAGPGPGVGPGRAPSPARSRPLGVLGRQEWKGHTVQILTLFFFYIKNAILETHPTFSPNIMLLPLKNKNKVLILYTSHVPYKNVSKVSIATKVF